MSRLSVWNGTSWGEPLTPLEKMLQTPGATWAHRGGSANWPEMTKFAYEQSLQAGYGCLEVSLGRSVDGVWFGLHDGSLDRTSQVSGVDHTQLTWADISANYEVVIGASGAPQPYMSWEDLISDLDPNVILVVDPKYEITAGTTRVMEFLDVIYDGWGPDRTIIKFYGVGSGALSLSRRAKERGFKQTWGYFYQSDYENGNLAASEYEWTILGMDHGANQQAWDDVTSYGKPVVGHIIPSLSVATTTLAKGADMLQVANVLDVPAVNTWM